MTREVLTVCKVFQHLRYARERCLRSSVISRLPARAAGGVAVTALVGHLQRLTMTGGTKTKGMNWLLDAPPWALLRSLELSQVQFSDGPIRSENAGSTARGLTR